MHGSVRCTFFGVFWLCLGGPLAYAAGSTFPYELKYGRVLQEGCGSALLKKSISLQSKGHQLYWIQRRSVPAIRLLKTALASEPRLFPSYLTLANHYCTQQKNCTKAIALLKIALKHCPSEPVLYFELGNNYAALERFGLAIKAMNLAKKMGMNNSSKLHYKLANIYFSIRKYGAATENYKQAIKLDKNYLLARKKLIISLYRKGEVVEAIDQAIKLENLDGKGSFGSWAKQTRSFISSLQ